MATDSKSVGTEKKVHGDVEDDKDLFTRTRKKFYRKSQTELIVGYAVHFVLLGFYVFVRVYEATVIKRMSKESYDAAFSGAKLYGGRWKYLTYIDLWVQTAYFFLAFFVDVMPNSSVRVFLAKAVDFMFTTVAYPMAMFVFLSFWGIYAINRELIFPQELDKHLPTLLNHLWHTTVGVCVMIELLLVYHKYPRASSAALMQFFISTTYIIWISFVLLKTNTWPYPFLMKMSPPMISVFFAGCFVLNLAIFFSGQVLSRIRFGDVEPAPEGEKED